MRALTLLIAFAIADIFGIYYISHAIVYLMKGSGALILWRDIVSAYFGTGLFLSLGLLLLWGFICDKLKWNI